MKNNIEAHKNMITELFKLKPYSKERYEKANEIKNFGKETGLYCNYYDMNLENKTVQCNISIKNDGLYERLETFTITNITNIDKYSSL